MDVQPDTYKVALLHETREELAKADAKASILLAASGIAFLALLTVGSQGSWYPDNLSKQAARIAAWLALVFTLAGICLVAAAVKPRLREKHNRAPKPYFFGDVEAYRPPIWHVWHRSRKLREARDRFADEFRALDGERVEEDRLIDQIWTLSHIAYRKYRLVSFGMWLYGAALVAAMVALVVEKRWL